jgi:hypothetical protein
LSGHCGQGDKLSKYKKWEVIKLPLRTLDRRWSPWLQSVVFFFTSAYVLFQVRRKSELDAFRFGPVSNSGTYRGMSLSLFFFFCSCYLVLVELVYPHHLRRISVPERRVLHSVVFCPDRVFMRFLSFVATFIQIIFLKLGSELIFTRPSWVMIHKSSYKFKFLAYFSH